MRGFNVSTFQAAVFNGNSPVALANMIVTTTRITVSPAKRGELFQTISTLLTLVEKEKGCLGSHFYLDSSDGNSAMLIEEWEREEDWSNHLQSRECAVLLGAVSALCGLASVDFRLLSYVAGIEAITAGRSSDANDHQLVSDPSNEADPIKSRSPVLRILSKPR